MDPAQAASYVALFQWEEVEPSAALEAVPGVAPAGRAGVGTLVERYPVPVANWVSSVVWKRRASLGLVRAAEWLGAVSERVSFHFVNHLRAASLYADLGESERALELFERTARAIDFGADFDANPRWARVGPAVRDLLARVHARGGIGPSERDELRRIAE